MMVQDGIVKNNLDNFQIKNNFYQNVMKLSSFEWNDFSISEEHKLIKNT